MACVVIFLNFFVQSQWKLKGWGNLCDKKGKILDGAFINKPSNQYTVKQATGLMTKFIGCHVIAFLSG
jgi:hypothetical protein